MSYEDIEKELGYSVLELKGFEEFEGTDVELDEDPAIDDLKDEPPMFSGEKFSFRVGEKRLEQINLLLKNTKIKDKGLAVLVCLKYFDDQMVSEEDKKELMARAKTIGESLSDEELEEDF